MFLVYTVWACLKGMTSYKTLKEEPTNQNHYDDNYSAVHIRDCTLSFTMTITTVLSIYAIARSLFRFILYLPLLQLTNKSLRRKKYLQ